MQSTFPTARIRKHPLPRGTTLTLGYRLWVHPGTATEEELVDAWAAYNRPGGSGAEDKCE